MRTVILAIGREILRGRVRDTNSWTLARRLTGLGHEVIRIASCDDDLAAASCSMVSFIVAWTARIPRSDIRSSIPRARNAAAVFADAGSRWRPARPWRRGSS